MTIANPAGKFNLAKKGNTLFAKPAFERRNVCVLSTAEANMIDPRASRTKCTSRCHTHVSRSTVVNAVERGEMRWVDRHRNAAAPTDQSVATWQNTRSGPVHTMQMVAGLKGRPVPCYQLEKEST